MSKNFVNPTKVITGVNTRWSYANVWEAKSINGGAPKYSVSLIIPKSDTKTIEKIKAAIQAAYEEGESKLKGNGKTVPALSILKTPLRDGDLERPDDEAYANSYFVNANSGTAPGIVDADRQPIIDHSEVYSGVYGRASMQSRFRKRARQSTLTVIPSLAKSNAAAAAQAMWQGIKPERTAVDIRRGAAMKRQSTEAPISTRQETKSAVRACLSAMRMRPTLCIS